MIATKLPKTYVRANEHFTALVPLARRWHLLGLPLRDAGATELLGSSDSLDSLRVLRQRGYPLRRTAVYDRDLGKIVE